VDYSEPLFMPFAFQSKWMNVTFPSLTKKKTTQYYFCQFFHGTHLSMDGPFFLLPFSHASFYVTLLIGFFFWVELFQWKIIYTWQKQHYFNDALNRAWKCMFQMLTRILTIVWNCTFNFTLSTQQSFWVGCLL
jgi:hypothetical protein